MTTAAPSEASACQRLILCPSESLNFSENLDEKISGANGAQQGQAAIARERNEMRMTASVVTNEFVGQGA